MRVISDSVKVRLDGKVYTRFQILANAQHDAQRLCWKKSSTHANGRGLEQGIPNFEGAKRAITYFRRNGLVDAARALEYVVVGTFIPAHVEGT